MKYQNIKEEELKNRVAQDCFWMYDCTKIIGNVDFCVSMHQTKKELYEHESLLWAEAKRDSSDIYKSIVQLILTIGKERTFDKYLPPSFLGAFDGEKMAFIPYNEIHDVFYLNDFNWNVAPSNHTTKEFKLVYEKVSAIIDDKALLFNFIQDEKELAKFIKNNFAVSKFGLTRTKIDKNNFIVIYTKWLQTVKPTITVNWEIAKKNGIIDGDFYLADLLSAENKTLKDKLYVLLKTDHYVLDRKLDDAGMFSSKRTEFSDNQVAHSQFWNRYERPPKTEYWDFILNRRDLLVPQDIRERKGSFFTPGIWVELSQKYLADVFGEDWQEEYHVWDCAAGTGNLLAGLTNKNNLWASTLDKQDVDVMYDRIENGANLWKQQVFQFDFLNDDFIPISKGGKLPDELFEIISDANKRKKLIIYINPPYAEAASRVTVSGFGENKTDVAVTTKVYAKYFDSIGIAGRELFAQFLIRIYCEIPSCIIAHFSTLKSILAPNFSNFRKIFRAKLEKLFIVPANTFDNVNGKFPLGFHIWDTNNKIIFADILAEIYNKNDIFIGKKYFSTYDNIKTINDWLITTRNRHNENHIGFISCKGNDFQNANFIFIINDKKLLPHPRGSWITNKNFIEVCIYFAVRKVIPATWLNDRDQYLYPNTGWKTDEEFQNDCLTYTLFNNNISSKHGVNHWIPFTEKEVGSQGKFSSHFMISFLSGKIIQNSYANLFNNEDNYAITKREFSETAKQVFAAGRELWKYYHAQKFPSIHGGVDAEVGRGGYNSNSSLYDIREYFQGRNDKGKMNNKSEDEKYNELIENLRLALKMLAKKIEPRVYEYGFLKK